MSQWTTPKFKRCGWILEPGQHRPRPLQGHAQLCRHSGRSKRYHNSKSQPVSLGRKEKNAYIWELVDDRIWVLLPEIPFNPNCHLVCKMFANILNSRKYFYMQDVINKALSYSYTYLQDDCELIITQIKQNLFLRLKVIGRVPMYIVIYYPLLSYMQYNFVHKIPIFELFFACFHCLISLFGIIRGLTVSLI